MLKVDDLRAWYGATQALFGVSFELAEGETVALVGTNGAGKTTTVRAIAGVIEAVGKLSFGNEDISSLAPYMRARLGIATVPEGRGLFWHMTVLQNLSLGAGPGRKSDPSKVLDLFPALRSRMASRASDLSGGEQQMLAIARAVMREPRLLILDEPSLGLAPRIVDEVYAQLSVLQETGVTILLVEQSIPRAAAFAQRLCLLRTGQVATIVEASDTDSVRELSTLALGDSARGSQ